MYDVEILEPVSASGVTIHAARGDLRVAVDRLLRAGERCLVRLAEESSDRLTRVRVRWVREVRDGCIAGLEVIETSYLQ
jgi:hypothetical protein